MQDTGHVLFDNLGCGEERRRLLDEQIKSGERSFRDVSEEMWGSLRVPFEDGFKIMEKELEIDPGFQEFHQFCVANDIDFNVISAGLKPILRKVLDTFLGEHEVWYSRRWSLGFFPSLMHSLSRPPVSRLSPMTRTSDPTGPNGSPYGGTTPSLAMTRRYPSKRAALSRRRVPWMGKSHSSFSSEMASLTFRLRGKQTCCLPGGVYAWKNTASRTRSPISVSIRLRM